MHKFQPPTYTKRFLDSLMGNFTRWGGFAPMEPLPKGVRVTRGEVLCGGGNVDHPAMRFVMQGWKIETPMIRTAFSPRTPVETARHSPVPGEGEKGEKTSEVQVRPKRLAAP